MFELYVLVLVLAVLIYYFLKAERDYWKNRNVPNAPGTLLFGNLGASLFFFKSMAQIYADIYKQFEGYKFCGVVNFRKPAVLIRDLDLVRSIVIKDFNKFHDNLIETDEKEDPILSKNPFFSKGDKWKQIRSQVSPQFTAVKVKKMFPLVAEVCTSLQNYLDHQAELSQVSGLNAKELAAKFTAEVIASCAFGLQGKSFEEEDSEFIKMGNKIFDGSVMNWILTMIQFFVPELRKIMAPKFLAVDIAEWFKSIVLDTIKTREELQIKRNDFLDVIKEMKNTTTAFEFTPDHMVAHCLTFFLDGFETSAVALQYALYELGANLDVQRKVREEIDVVLAKHHGEFTYDALQEMTYLEMVFLETVRKYPPLLFMSRLCTETTTLPPAIENGPEVIIEKDVGIIIPVLAIHHDPQYYPDPDMFDPLRFTEEAKSSRPRQAFLGFGDGPRVCLGQRFATVQVKAALATIVANFAIRVNKKRTIVPLELDPTSFVHAPKGGVWVNFYNFTREASKIINSRETDKK